MWHRFSLWFSINKTSCYTNIQASKWTHSVTKRRGVGAYLILNHVVIQNRGSRHFGFAHLGNVYAAAPTWFRGCHSRKSTICAFRISGHSVIGNRCSGFIWFEHLGIAGLSISHKSAGSVNTLALHMSVNETLGSYTQHSSRSLTADWRTKSDHGTRPARSTYWLCTCLSTRHLVPIRSTAAGHWSLTGGPSLTMAPDRPLVFWILGTCWIRCCWCRTWSFGYNQFIAVTDS